MDQKERIEQLKVEVQRLAGGKAVMGGIDETPPDIAEQFLEHVIAVEKEDVEQRKPRTEGVSLQALPMPSATQHTEDMGNTLWRDR
jgi:hypothetical protein